MGHGGGNGGAWEGRHLLRDIKELCLLLAKLDKVASKVALHFLLAPSNALLALVELELPRLELELLGLELLGLLGELRVQLEEVIHLRGIEGVLKL